MERVPVPENKEVAIGFRATEAEKAEWQAEADRQGVALSKLIRFAINEYCGQRKKSKKST
jgi:hypothetical protein